MQMTDSEVKTDVLQAADQKKQVTICAQVNGVSPDKIREILKAQGVDLRSLKGKKKQINHGDVERKSYKKPANAEKNPANSEKKSPLAELNERIESLIKQKAGIESEIEDLRAQLTKMIDMLAGGIAE